MNRDDELHDFDMLSMLSKPLYFGLVYNIAIPGGILFACFYYSNNYHPSNKIPELANLLFYILAAMAVGQAGLAIWWRDKLMKKPMVRRIESIEADIAHALTARSKPVFLLISTISSWGLLYFLLTGRFESCAMFVIFSFVVFQVVRPRIGRLEKIIKYQMDLADSGEFAPGILDDK